MQPLARYVYCYILVSKSIMRFGHIFEILWDYPCNTNNDQNGLLVVVAVCSGFYLVTSLK